MCLALDSLESFAKMDPLMELVDLLAKHVQLADNKIEWIQQQGSFSGKDQCLVSSSQLKAVLALASFLSRCKDLHEQGNSLAVVLDFLKAVPSLASKAAFPKWFNFDSASLYFNEFCGYLVRISDSGLADRIGMSSIISNIIRSTVIMDREPFFTIARALLYALSYNCPSIHVSLIDEICSCLLQHCILPTLPGTPTSSPVQRKKLASSISNGGQGYSEDHTHNPSRESLNLIILEHASEHNLKDDSANSTPSTTPSVMTLSGNLAGIEPLALAHGLNDGAVKHYYLQDLQEKSVHDLEKQEIAFRFFAGMLINTGHHFLANDGLIFDIKAKSAEQLKSIPSILKSRKRDWIIEGTMLRSKLNKKFQACNAAATVYTHCFLLRKSDGKGHKSLLRETLALLLDAADACAVASFRRLRTCESLFDCILQNVALVAPSCTSQILKVLLLRLKALILVVCAQVDPWSKGHGPMFDSIVKASCRIVTAGWNTNQPDFESFLLVLATSAREHNEQEERERQVIATMQLNIIKFLADSVILMGKPDVAETIFPLFIESLEEGEACCPSRLRMQLLDAVARIAGMGFERPYRETVVLLTRSYLDKLSMVGSMQSSTLPSEAMMERAETLPWAFLTIASNLTQPKTREDYRHRLLMLCSDVGLAAQSKCGKNGADFLGPLLPAVSEICGDFDCSGVVEPSLLKLFRNLWFYIVLFGLAPPIQRVPTPSKVVLASIPSGGSTSALPLQAVTGPYTWNMQWSESVTKIAHGTPPLVVSSVKWIEDELELHELHNPGCQSGSNNEKATKVQRSALYVALKDHIDMASINTMSGVRATYFLAVAFLEILRLNHHGGLFKSDTLEKQTGNSALRCVFEYLEKPNLAPTIYQCLIAIAFRAFDAAMAWLDDKRNLQNVSIDEIELVIATHGRFLISRLAHKEDNVRDLSCKLLNQLKTKHPQVLWNSSCLGTLFRLVCSQGMTTVDSAHVGSIRPLIQQQIRDWLVQSIVLAPCTSLGLLQEQFCSLNSRTTAMYVSDLLMLLAEIRLDPRRNECGGNNPVAIPVLMSAAAAAAGARPELTQLGNLEVFSNSIISANIKSNYIHVNIGGVTFGQGHLEGSASGMLFGGLKQADMHHRSEKVRPARRVLKENLVASFLGLLQQFISALEEGAFIDIEAFRETCFRSAAFIVSELEITDNLEMQELLQLVRLLCWCPARICLPEAMETGIFVWTWLISSAPQLSAVILSELVDAWLWTIEAQYGLFALGPADSGPAAKLRPHLSPGEPVSSTNRDPVEGIAAHYLWIGFIFDRFEVARHSCREQLSLIGRLLHGSFKRPNCFSLHPAATGTFFSLLVLGLKFCASQLHLVHAGNVGVFLLEDRLLRAALGWFSVEPGFFDLNIEGFAQSEFHAIATFAQHLSLYNTESLSMSESICKPYVRGNGLATSNTKKQDTASPIWGRCENWPASKEKQKQLLVMLSQHEADRLDTWANPLRENMPSRCRVSSDCWGDYVKTAWAIDPRIAFALASRFPSVNVLKTELASLVQAHLPDLYNIPQALPFFVTPKAAEENSINLQYLPHWAPCSITRALEFLTPAYRGHPRVMAYVLRVLETYPPDRVTFFMPQLVQMLRYDDGGLVERYLITAAQRSHFFAHVLIWQLQGEEPSSEEIGKGLLKENTFQDTVLKVKDRIIASFNKESFDMFTREFTFFNKVTDISGALYPLPKEERRAGIRRELEKIQVDGDDLYLPTAPSKLVRSIQLDSGIPLQSAAKVPIMVTFNVVDKDEPMVTMPQACIFKVGDDCRQDVLALQVISLLRDIFQAVNLNLYLFPYGVLPTGCGKGIIEVVPNTRSRNQMGETTDGGLYEIFQQDYGPVGSSQFEKARDNFIVSSAGYAVASLLLQPKDRHNGNLLFDSQGRLVHIDFGFILETSPGGNLRFESAQFKLSHEMTQLLDPSGVMKSETWNRFVSLCVKGYLAARLYMDEIINTVMLMTDSGLPCFSRGDPIGNLRKRFHPEMSDREAANFMINTCVDAYNKWTTAGYDLIQYLQQGIEK